MALTIDTIKSCGELGSAGAVLTYPHTIDAGSDKLLEVTVELADEQTVSTVTWDGAGLTELVTVNCALGFCKRVYFFFLKAPATGGPHNIVVTLNGAARMSSSARSFSGADQTTPHGTPVSNCDSGIDNISIAVGAAVGDLVIDAVLMGGSNSNLASTGGQTESCNAAIGAVAIHGASRKAGAASVTMSWEHTGGFSRNWGIIGVAIKPAAAASAPIPFPLAYDRQQSMPTFAPIL